MKIKQAIKSFGLFLKNLFIAIFKNDLFGVSAEIAFFLAFSIFPIVISLIAILSMVARNPDFYLNMTSFIYSSLPEEVATFLNYNLRILANSVYSGSALVLGFFVALWTSSNVINSLIKGINRAYKLRETRSFIRLQLLSLSLIFSIGLLLLTAFGLIVFGENFIKWIVETRVGILPDDALLRYNILRWTIVCVLLFLVSSLLYYKAPNKTHKFIKAIPGALFFSISWIIFTSLFGVYINIVPNYNATYGALATFIILLLWFYLSAMTFLIGAQINALLYHDHTEKSLSTIFKDIKLYVVKKITKK